MLKFGQIIDLHILEKVGVDEGASELQAKLAALESGGVARAEEWDQRIESARDELARITEQNTRWLDKVAKLTKAQYDLEDTLNHTRNVHVADSAPLDEQADVERRQLLELVQLQEREVDALKAEIHVLRRKGGQVYTPQA
jgi:predicted nuclease with TOPRIM domain